mmetsp:Transcript_1751/g.2633  ORF Transcript_1751/g.2633 Transcript_1751/m.2633 type:complete len:134 (-) Transcript_1751:292-693(-)
MHLVHCGCIKPLCDLLTVPDAKIILVALEGLENILKVGEAEAKAQGIDNQLALHIEEAGGLQKIEELQNHNEEMVFSKASKIIQRYYDEEGEDEGLVPDMNEDGQFQFGMNNQGQQNMQPPPGAGGFNFTGLP